MRLTILTKRSDSLDTKCDAIVMNTYEGQICILPSHTHYISTLPVSIINLKRSDKSQKVAIKGGIVWVFKDHIRIFTEDYIKKSDELSEDHVKKSIHAIERRIKKEGETAQSLKEKRWQETILRLIKEQ